MENQSRRKFLKEAAAMLAATACLFTKGDSDREQSERQQYELLLGSHNFNKVRRRLMEIVICDESSNKSISGYEAVFRLFENGYDPTLERDKLEELVKSLSDDEEEGIYCLRVAHSLWVEQQKVVSWSLDGYSGVEVDYLFHVPFSDIERGEKIERRPKMPLHNASGFDYSPDWLNSKLELEASVLLFPIARKLQGKSQHETIINIIRWIKSNFFHAYTDQDGVEWGWKKYKDEQTKKSAIGVYFPSSLDRYFQERISDCHLPSMLMASLARALNIPALNINVEGHGMVYLSTEKRFAHGDHLSNLPLFPAELLLLSSTDVRANIEKDPMLWNIKGSLNSMAGTEEIDRYYAGMLSSVTIGREGDNLKINGALNTTRRFVQLIQRELAPFSPQIKESSGGVLDVNFRGIPIKTLDQLRETK